MEPATSPLKSKTLWTNVIMAAGTAVVQEVTKSLDPATVGVVFAVVNGLLRLVTKRPIKLG